VLGKTGKDLVAFQRAAVIRALERMKLQLQVGMGLKK
jgi:hypothetical protein